MQLSSESSYKVVYKSIFYVYKRIYQILTISHIELLGVQNGLRGGARIGNIRIEISIRLLISIRFDHVDLQFSY